MTALRVVFALGVAVVAACAPIAQEGTATEGSATRDAPRGAGTTSKGEPTLLIDPARSLVVVLVRRGGPLARFGHDHVVASHSITGEIAPGDGWAELSIPVRDLVVDEPGLRQVAGLSSTPSAADVDATRTNMLAHVLVADKAPAVRVAVTGVQRPPAGTLTLPATVSVNGVSRSLAIAASFARSGDEVRIHGSTTLRQSDFGIVPFSILGGALTVEDQLAVRFDIVARSRPSGG